MTDKDASRILQIAEAVDDLVQPGEAWVVRKEEDSETKVHPINQSKLASTNPELYGRLLQVSEQLSNAGGSLCIWGPLVVLLGCLGLHLHWFDGLLDDTLEKLRNLWFYAAAAVISFFLFGSIARTWERFRYRQFRDAVLHAVDAAKLSPHRLIAEIEGDDALENLADQLKADPHIV